MPKPKTIAVPDENAMYSLDELVQRAAVIVAAWTERGPEALADYEYLRPGMVGCLTRLGVLGRATVNRRKAVVPVRLDPWLAEFHAKAGGATGADPDAFLDAQRRISR